MPTKIQQLQAILGVPADGAWGPRSQSALDTVIHGTNLPDGTHKVLASSFADPADVRAFRACIRAGGTKEDCFKVGDNGRGCWGDDTTTTEPQCALPPEDMEERWGSIDAARHKMVSVTANGRTVLCRLTDRMPRRANIKNGRGIDLTPGACAALGLRPPVETSATWSWV